MSDLDDDTFLPHMVDAEGRIVAAGAAYTLPGDDLFGSVDAFIGALVDNSSPSPPIRDRSSHVALVVYPGVVITLDRTSVRPSHIQCLLAALRRRTNGYNATSQLTSHTIDPTFRLKLWVRGGQELASYAAEIWREISDASLVDPLVALTTPALYGNKLRLTSFIGPVIATSLGRGEPLLDLMAGTGIIARTMANRNRVSVNDANPYAALFSRCQGLDANHLEATSIVSRLRAPYMHNHENLSALVSRALNDEASFFHGDLDIVVAKNYAAFTSIAPLPITDGKVGVFRLATERYANIYFGIGQSIEIDSLRAAIDAAYPTNSIERDLCLCALLLACATCASGPHFAQPLRIKSAHALRIVVERRARSVAWEFDLALERLIGRASSQLPFDAATSMNWREALIQFARHTSGAAAGVYIDPPYSKLQYSRYYHVLNVLLSYDYPPVAGIGRYPPRSHRFSSRFEYQPGVAQREIFEVLQLCSDHDLTPILSYSDTGFVKIKMIAQAMARMFRHVDVFSEELRHHSQGRSTARSRHNVIEYALIGRPL